MRGLPLSSTGRKQPDRLQPAPMARTASTHATSPGKRNGIRVHRAQRAFSPIELLNFWEPTGAWEEYRGLVYGDGPRQRLDVYRPRRAAKAPILVFCYGGSWQRGSRDLYRFVDGASLAVARQVASGFRSYWRWKSRSRGGRPQIETDLRALIRRMSIENPLWGAPRIHGELLKLGFEVAQSSVGKYMVKRRGTPSQG